MTISLPEYFYHVARKDALASILQNGLLPRNKHQGNLVWTDAAVCEDCIYFYHDLDDAKEYADSLADGFGDNPCLEPIILQIPTEQLDLNLMMMDHEDFADVLRFGWINYCEDFTIKTHAEITSLRKACDIRPHANGGEIYPICMPARVRQHWPMLSARARQELVHVALTSGLRLMYQGKVHQAQVMELVNR